MKQSNEHPSLQGFGLGLREEHMEEVLRTRPIVDWFELLTENLLNTPAIWDYAQELRRHYPLVLHGVALNIASTDPLDEDYLKQLTSLVRVVKPACLSDHLSWTALGGLHSHELLPLPYTQESLAHVAVRVSEVQDRLGLPLVLENPSAYARFKTSTMPEEEFLTRLCARTGCRLLLDVNNLYVSAVNLGLDPRRDIDALEDCPIAYLHLAGHRARGAQLVDTHDRPVSRDVWDLYRYTLIKRGMLPTMIEWDSDIPPFTLLLAELDKARALSREMSWKAAS